MGRRKTRDKTRVSYVKKQMAVRSKISFCLALAALALFGTSMTIAVRSQGHAPDNVAALGLCCFIISIAGTVYSILAFMEQEKNYILAKISVFLCGTLVAIWLIMIFIGLGG